MGLGMLPGAAGDTGDATVGDSHRLPLVLSCSARNRESPGSRAEAGGAFFEHSWSPAGSSPTSTAQDAALLCATISPSEG